MYYYLVVSILVITLLVLINVFISAFWGLVAIKIAQNDLPAPRLLFPHK